MGLIREFASDMKAAGEEIERYSSALGKRIFGKFRKLVEMIKTK